MARNNELRTKTEIKAATRAAGQVDVEVSRVGITVMGFVAALIGIWGVACFIGGLVSSGGPLSFAKGWFSAVLGL